MSLGNSYFKKGNIDELLRYCVECFSQVNVLIMDAPSVHTYKARGYDQIEAEQKARTDGNRLKNHTKRSIDAIIEQNPEAKIELVKWDDVVESNVLYQQEYGRMQELYSENEIFREDIRETTGSVVGDVSEAIDEGVHYLLKELASLSVSPEIFGVDRVVDIYHRRWKIYEYFVDGKYEGSPRDDLGFLIVE